MEYSLSHVSLEEISKRLEAIPGVHAVEVKGDGYHYQLTVVSDQFKGLPRIKREQWVYAQLMEWITSGQLHAVTMKTQTVEEWEQNHG
jgi:acid stress-induced BolA-like protein IbaG/YrbA